MKLKYLFLFCLIFFLIASCGKKEKDVIKIGVIQPLTGPIAIAGQRVLQGIEIAVEEFNNNTLNLKVNLIIEDSKGEASEGVKAINKLLDIDKVQVIIGDLTSTVFLATATIAERNKILMISPAASNPKISQAGEYIYRIWPSDDYDAKIAAKYIYKNIGKINAGILFVRNDYGQGLMFSFEKEFTSLGGQIIFSDGFNFGQTDFRTLISKLKNRNPEIVYLAGTPKEMGYILNQMAEVSYKPILFTTVSAEETDFRNIAKETSSGIYYNAPVLVENTAKNKLIEFIHKTNLKYNIEADIMNFYGFDVTNIILECIKKEDSLPKVNKDCLNNKEFEGLTGKFSFDENGDVLRKINIKRFDPQSNEVIILE